MADEAELPTIIDTKRGARFAWAATTAAPIIGGIEASITLTRLAVPWLPSDSQHRASTIAGQTQSL